MDEIDLRAFLDPLKREQRIEFLLNLLHEVKFEIRLSSLTDKEAEQLNSIGTLSKGAREKAETFKTKKGREYYLDAIARA